ncbi:hypothetical protein J4H86_25625 [Spiractinospora alimapuensis]|uniref:SCO7613 C-terminal domain-containing membrane protein n=1 Tax=Spiractinospora alimapuensis TaxID=2820884 RepID=UPI001F309E76|nr:hypothetical protein [Spiractinospora alimapuensis]QVQ52058.1 hypothetical protein J4H86_25625 [Spiractinospora alimapuensis]
MERERAELVFVRDSLLSAVSRPQTAAPPVADARPPVEGSRPVYSGSVPAPSRARRWEFTSTSVRNLLLVLGAVLLGVASLVFAVVSWSELSVATRGTILGGVTVLVAGLPLVFLRYRLTATAETLGALGAALLVIDALALWSVVPVDRIGTPAYVASAAAVITVVLVGYSWAVPLRAPRVLAVVVGQLVAPALALWGDPALWLGLAPIINAVVLGLGLRTLPAPGRVVGTVARWSLLLSWAAAIVVALAWVALPPDVHGLDVATGGIRWAPPVQFLGCALVGVTCLVLWPRSRHRGALVVATTSLALGVAPAAVIFAEVPVLPVLTLTLVALPAMLLAVWGPRLAEPDRVAVGAVAFVAACAVPTLVAPRLVEVMASPLVGILTFERPGTLALMEHAGHPLLLTTLALATATLVGWAGWRSGRWAAGATALSSLSVLLPTSVAAVPVPYGVALTVSVVVAGALLASVPVFAGWRARLVVWAGLVTSYVVVAWSAFDPLLLTLVLVTLGVCAVAGAVLPILTTRSASGGPRTAPAALSVTATVSFALAGAAAWFAFHDRGVELDPRWFSAPVLTVAAGALAVTWLARRANGNRRTDLAWTVVALAGASAVISWVGTGIPPLLLAGAAVVTASSAALSAGRVRPVGLTVTAGLVIAAGATMAGPWLTAQFGTWRWVVAPWSQRGILGSRAADALMVDSVLPASWPDLLALPAVGAAITLGVWATRRRLAAPVAGAVFAVVLAPLPVMANAPVWLVILVLVVLALTLLGVPALPPRIRPTPLAGRVAAVGSVWVLLTMLSWSLAESTPTLVGLVVVVGAGLGVQILGRDVPLVSGAAALCTLATGGFAVALMLTFGQPAEVASLGAVAVVAGGIGVTSTVSLPRPLSMSVEVASGLLGLVAVCLTLAGTQRLELTSVCLAVLGVIALGGATRPERRWYVPVAGILLLAALWCAMGWLRVTIPEPYLLPPGLAALVLGWDWRRRAVVAGRPAPSSWLSAGPGLALLGPTAVLVLAPDPDPIRLGALAVAGLACTLVGAWRRSQCPLVVGAAVLALVAQRAFGTPLWELVVAVPAWVPLGFAGVVILVVATRFERTVAELRRAGSALRSLE